MALQMPVVTVTAPEAGSRMICHRGTPSMSIGRRLTLGSGIGRLPRGVSAGGTVGRLIADELRPPVASRMRGFDLVGQMRGKSLPDTETRRRWPFGTT